MEFSQPFRGWLVFREMVTRELQETVVLTLTTMQKQRQKCVNIQHVIKRQCLPTVYIGWWNRHYAFFEFVQLQSSKGLNTSRQTSKRFQTCVIVHSNYCCSRLHSWTAILAILVFTINLHYKVQFTAHLKRAKRLRIFRSDIEYVCGFSKKKSWQNMRDNDFFWEKTKNNVAALFN